MDKDIGTSIRDLRLQVGWTQQDLAVAAKVAINTIRHTEQGIIKNPQLDTLRAIRAALACSWDELLGS